MRAPLDERVTLSEAIEIAAKIAGSYATSRSISDTYLGAIASVLCSYPASIARRAHLCPGGVPAEYVTLPSPAQVIRWCEENVQPLRRRVARDERVARQLAEREDVKVQTTRGFEITRAWLDRSDPDAARLSGQQSRVKLDMRLRAEARAMLIAQIGQEAFDAIPNAPGTG